MAGPGPRLSGVRTFLFGALAAVWGTEMVFLGFARFSRVWAHLWQVPVPEDPELAAALSVTWAIAAPAKGALLVLAIAGLRSKDPSVRTALFASMALVPPLNIAFPFRYQGLLPGPVTVATVLSGILWGAFFLLRERGQERIADRARGPASRWDVARFAWFAAYAGALTLGALLQLVWPRAALEFALPCLASVDARAAGLSSVFHTGMASATHLLAVATAAWLAAFSARRNPALRAAVAPALAVHAGLLIVFPVRQIFLTFGSACASSSVLMAALPLFVLWLLYVTSESARSRTVSPEVLR